MYANNFSSRALKSDEDHFSLHHPNPENSFYRANFINSLTGFKSVATINQKEQSNLGIFNSLVHIGSDPALVGYINRPIKAAPHTLANILPTRVNRINHIHPPFLEQALKTSAKYPN